MGEDYGCATKVVHLAVTRPGRTVLIVCENMAQTGEFFQKIDRFPGTLGITAKGEEGKLMARHLPNGSRIVGIAAREAALRGYTVDFVFLDEAARIFGCGDRCVRSGDCGAEGGLVDGVDSAWKARAVLGDLDLWRGDVSVEGERTGE